MEEDILKCILFDQDAFRDVRMLAAEKRQRKWTAEYFPELSEQSKGEILYSRIPLPQNLMRNVTTPNIEDEVVMLSKAAVGKIVLLGSAQDGLYLEKGFPVIKPDGKDPVNETDLDILFQYDGIRIGQAETTEDLDTNYDLYTEQTKFPGYLKLRIPCKAEKKYFHSILMKHKLYADLYTSNFYVSPNKPNILMESPALVGATEDELGIHMLDYVMALKVNDILPESRSFLQRSRASGWPSQELLEAAISEGCGLVATGPRERKADDTFWRISFAMSERVLVKSLTNAQIRAYLFFKSLSKEKLWEPECLSSYMLKNILFWTLELIPQEQWCEDNMHGCIESLVDMLCAYLDQGMIPNYFIPKQNLLASMDAEILKEVTKKAHSLQENLFKDVVDITKSEDFQGFLEFSLEKLQINLFTSTDTERKNLLSRVFFSMYLNIRLQSRRYQLKLNTKTLEEVFENKTRSLFRAMPPRAAWYLCQSMQMNAEDFVFCIDDDQMIVDTSRMRKAVVKTWRDSIYNGIFTTVINDQEFATRRDIDCIPEFEEFVSWVDMTCLFNGQDRIDYKDDYINCPIILD